MITILPADAPMHELLGAAQAGLFYKVFAGRAHIILLVDRAHELYEDLERLGNPSSFLFEGRTKVPSLPALAYPTRVQLFMESKGIPRPAIKIKDEIAIETEGFLTHVRNLAAVRPDLDFYFGCAAHGGAHTARGRCTECRPNRPMGAFLVFRNGVAFEILEPYRPSCEGWDAAGYFNDLTDRIRNLNANHTVILPAYLVEQMRIVAAANELNGLDYNPGVFHFDIDAGSPELVEALSELAFLYTMRDAVTAVGDRLEQPDGVADLIARRGRTAANGDKAQLAKEARGQQAATPGEPTTLEEALALIELMRTGSDAGQPAVRAHGRAVTEEYQRLADNARGSDSEPGDPMPPKVADRGAADRTAEGSGPTGEPGPGAVVFDGTGSDPVTSTVAVHTTDVLAAVSAGRDDMTVRKRVPDTTGDDDRSAASSAVVSGAGTRERADVSVERSVAVLPDEVVDRDALQKNGTERPGYTRQQVERTLKGRKFQEYHGPDGVGTLRTLAAQVPIGGFALGVEEYETAGNSMCARSWVLKNVGGQVQVYATAMGVWLRLVDYERRVREPRAQEERPAEEGKSRVDRTVGVVWDSAGGDPGV